MKNKEELLFDAKEHRACSFYSPNGEESLVETLEVAREQVIGRTCESYEIVFVHSGTITVTCADFGTVSIPRRRLFLLPPGSVVSYSAVIPAYVLICRLDEALKYCGNMSIGKLQEYFEDDGRKIYTLPYRRPISRYAEGLAACTEDGLRCRTYLMAKHTELFYLLRGYYSKKELAAFFRPFLGNDMNFRSHVSLLIHQGKNVGEMTEDCHLSENGFRSKFKREFGQSPRDYIMTRKKALIFDAIANGIQPFKQIAIDNKISGLSSLDKFCLEQFGQNPSEIRKTKGDFVMDNGKSVENT